MACFRLVLRQEKRQVFNGKRLQETLAHGSKHGVQIGLRTQRAREFDQCAPVIVAVAVEVPVQAFLNPVANRLEKKGRHQDHGGQPQVAETMIVLLD
jgi:hypothetical protein